MIADLNAVPVFQDETMPVSNTDHIKSIVLERTGCKIKQITAWINPKNWFSRFSAIDIDMSEFACKKTLPKE